MNAFTGRLTERCLRFMADSHKFPDEIEIPIKTGASALSPEDAQPFLKNVDLSSVTPSRREHAYRSEDFAPAPEISWPAWLPMDSEDYRPSYVLGAVWVGHWEFHEMFEEFGEWVSVRSDKILSPVCWTYLPNTK